MRTHVALVHFDPDVIFSKQHTRRLDCRLRQTHPVAVHEQSIRFGDAGSVHDQLIFVDTDGATVGIDLRLSTDLFAYVGCTDDETVASSQDHGCRTQNRGQLTPPPSLDRMPY